VLLDAGIILLPQSRSLPELSLTNQDGRMRRSTSSRMKRRTKTDKTPMNQH
jgi:hypothetical protein